MDGGVDGGVCEHWCGTRPCGRACGKTGRNALPNMVQRRWERLGFLDSCHHSRASGTLHLFRQRRAAALLPLAARARRPPCGSARWPRHSQSVPTRISPRRVSARATTCAWRANSLLAFLCVPCARPTRPTQRPRACPRVPRAANSKNMQIFVKTLTGARRVPITHRSRNDPHLPSSSPRLSVDRASTRRFRRAFAMPRAQRLTGLPPRRAP